MSMFLPEPSSEAANPTAVAINSPSADPSSEDVALMQRVFAAAAKAPTLIPDAFMASILDWLQVSNIEIPISQVFGYAQTVATVSVAPGSQSKTSSTYSTITGGPFLDGLPDGKYLVLWGSAAAGSPAVSNAEMAIGVNGVTSTPGGDNAQIAFTGSATSTSIMTGDTFKLKNGGSNRLDTIYASSDNSFSCSWQNRWIIAIRLGNI